MRSSFQHTGLGPILQYFFTQHLVSNKRASPQTIVSYRDTFRLLLQFLQGKTGKTPAELSIADLDAPNLLLFLEHLEQKRHNQICSRNVRLTAIRSFFQVVALRDPGSLGIVTRVLAIPAKKTDKRLIGFVTKEEMDAIVAVPDQTTWAGRRDHALLLTTYNTGARMSEMRGLRQRQVKLEPNHCHLAIEGKGRKERLVPLWPETTRALKRWMNELDGQPDDVVFPSARGTPLSTDGVDYILQKAVLAACKRCGSLKGRHITPHMVRHGTAMALLQAGVHISVIALYLGHEHIQTTQVYVQADLAMKEKALAKIAPPKSPFRRYRASDRLLGFLASL